MEWEQGHEPIKRLGLLWEEGRVTEVVTVCHVQASVILGKLSQLDVPQG